MKTVTFSQFRNNARKYIDAVEEGEELEIVRHGKPVALVSPLPKERNARYWKSVKPLFPTGLALSRQVLQERKEGRW